MSTKLKTAQITECDLLQRINQKLAHANECIVKARGRAISQYGKFHKVDTCKNVLLEDDVQLEKTGRELQVMKPWESLSREIITIDR